MLQRGESAASVAATTGLQPAVAQVLAEEVHTRQEADQLEWTQEAKRARARLEWIDIFQQPDIVSLPEGLLSVAESLHRASLHADAWMLAEFAATMVGRWRYLLETGKPESHKTHGLGDVLSLLSCIRLLPRERLRAIRKAHNKACATGCSDRKARNMIRLGWWLVSHFVDLGRDDSKPARSFEEALQQYKGRTPKGGVS